MTITLIQTKETDGDWYKVKVDDYTKACIGIYPGREETAYLRALEIFTFLVENKGEAKVIKSLDV
jgi:hypothetical protein